MKINHMIDHTALKPNTSLKEIKLLSEQAVEHHFASICIPPTYVKEAKDLISGSEVKLCTVLGFPLGYQSSELKQKECLELIQNGAQEIDMVINNTDVVNERWDSIHKEVESLQALCSKNNILLKVIIETALLSKDQIIKLCEIFNKIKIDFAKTSTGFSTRGASLEDIQLMRKHLNDNIQIKASGGIKTREFAIELIEAGATRIGASASLKLIQS